MENKYLIDQLQEIWPRIQSTLNEMFWGKASTYFTHHQIEDHANLLLRYEWQRGFLDSEVTVQTGQDPINPDAIYLTFFDQDGRKIKGEYVI